MTKKDQKNKRMITRFVNVAYDLSVDEGIDSLTIRKIAENAGYNSATIYNYFENLDHLVFYTAMRSIKDYALALPEYTKNANNAMDIFMMVWECYCDYSFAKPEVYNAIFFPKLNKCFEDYIEEYYELFPEDLANTSDRINTMLLKSDITQRGNTAVEGLVEEGYIRPEDADYLNNVTLLLFEGMLRRLIRGITDFEGARKDTMAYIKAIMEKNLIRDYDFHF